MSRTTETIFQFTRTAKERLFGKKKSGPLGVRSPDFVRALPWPARVALAIATLLSLALLVGLSIGAFGTLFASLLAIYLLLTKVLGLPLQADPEALLRYAQNMASKAYQGKAS